MFQHGEQLRSDELAARLAGAERHARGALRSAQDLRDRLDQIGLALLTIEGRLPEDKPQTPSRPAQLFLPVRPLLGCELLGSSVVTARTKAKSALLTDVVDGYGHLSLLRPGEVWATLSPQQTDRFEARLEPAVLMEYNELVLPFIAGGPLSWRLYHSRGYHEYRGVTQTTVYRTQAPREFNGMVEVISESRTGLEGQFIHTAAGIAAQMSDFLPKGTLEAVGELPFTGVVRVDGVYLFPGRVPVTTYRLEHAGADKTGIAQFAALTGETLRLEIEIPWDAAVNYVSIELYHTA
jgi:hypothetical protein